MNVKELILELDLEKDKFNIARSRIEELRLKIAHTICPIKISEQVKFLKDGKYYEGIVEYIHYATHTTDGLFPQRGALTGWCVGGHRINKTTGKVGKVSFSIVSFDVVSKNGVWEYTERTLEQLLGD